MKMIEIASQVAARHSLTVFDLKAATQEESLVRARDEFYYLAYKNGFALPRIAKFIDKNVGTVGKGRRRHMQRNNLVD